MEAFIYGMLSTTIFAGWMCSFSYIYIYSKVFPTSYDGIVGVSVFVLYYILFLIIGCAISDSGFYFFLGSIVLLRLIKPKLKFTF